MKREELAFKLPTELIAQQPAQPRDACRLMVLHRANQLIEHHHFYDLASLLKAGDLLVFNQSKVLPARIMAKRVSGGRVEILLLRDLGKGIWTCLLGGNVKEDEAIDWGKGLLAMILPKSSGGDSRVHLNKQGQELLEILQHIGLMPTPPYVKQILSDSNLYQTVFAKELGSAAAPTAGLHFTQDLLDKLGVLGVQQEFVTLHVGLGTFQPVKTDRVEDHPIHSEWYSLDRATMERLVRAKKEGRRIIAVGTTSVRVLETVFSQQHIAQNTTDDIITGETSIFIYPGYRFRAIDGLITNFHTPYSSLLALVYAFAEQDFIRQAYNEAIKKHYRFFSFGDAMFIQ